ncbi:hypothetical protein [Hymenobacter actinosclerus]|uniref:Uncharacterized protein n=1 Tax=Hymenobacter actinosclerus TaxID=82805 RepID=A0A1I0JB63_9BACT|nr:hypothetical protein [Hymenobacter actinosclerus]SEU06525.1 hypothetical protein SAMN04487998_3731 [Hymenobacter actinosclerus]
MSRAIGNNHYRVTALAGRRPDEINAEVVRFPLDNIIAVREQIKQLFSKQRFTHLVCAAACGADLLALDVATDLDVECHIILPFEPSEFLLASVTDRPGGWKQLYDRLIIAAEKSDNLYLLGYSRDDDEAFSKTTKAIVAHAKKLANGKPASAIVVWEGQSRGNDDATEEFAILSRNEGLHTVEIITV